MWSCFNEFVDEWDARSRVKGGSATVARVSPLRSQHCDLDGSKIATQTHLNNQFEKTHDDDTSASPRASQPALRTLERGSLHEGSLIHTRVAAGTASSKDVARDKAYVRWRSDFLERGATWGDLSDLDQATVDAATDAELARRGSGQKIALTALMTGQGRSVDADAPLGVSDGTDAGSASGGELAATGRDFSSDPQLPSMQKSPASS